MRIIDDEGMAAAIQKLVNQSEIDLGGGIRYPTGQHSFDCNREIDYAQMVRNLMMIYGDEKRCEIYIAIFDKMREFVSGVLHITGLERLFSQHYYNIEWNMYMEGDFKESKWSFYRDHFVHQIRNAYFGYELLWGDEEFSFINIILECIKQEEDSDFSAYIKNCLGECGDKGNESIRVVLFKTWFISALFHDIGYPLAHFSRLENQIETYMPYFQCFNRHSRSGFLEIKSLLADSYLFSVVSYEELEKRYLKNDHGLLSALCLLLNYYHTGTIHSLIAVDRCSIELAAFSIFAHTNKYAIQKEESKDLEYYRPLFAQNPMAFLLRICDDLQEWERMYFLISNNSNILICNKCFSAVTTDKAKIDYRCQCGKQFKKLTQFSYRKINLVEVCRSLELGLDEEKAVSIRLNYDKFRLIEAAFIDEQYAKYRRKELKNLQKLLVNQRWLPCFRLHYFVSSNIRILKYEILREFFGKREDTWNTLLDQKYNKEALDSEYTKLIEKEEELKTMLLEELKDELEESDKNVICNAVFEESRICLKELIKSLDNNRGFPYDRNASSQPDALNNIYFYYLLNKKNIQK